MRQVIIEATTWGLLVPFAFSLGWFCGVATANGIRRDERRRLEHRLPPLVEPRDASRGAENAIAASVLELHDRLGGFIKPSLPPQPDQNI